MFYLATGSSLIKTRQFASMEAAAQALFPREAYCVEDIDPIPPSVLGEPIRFYPLPCDPEQSVGGTNEEYLRKTRFSFLSPSERKFVEITDPTGMDQGIRRMISKNMHTPDAVRMILTRDPDETVRYNIARTHCTSSDVLIALSKDSSGITVKSALVRDVSETPVEALEQLAKYQLPIIWSPIRFHKNVTPEILDTLLGREAELPRGERVSFRVSIAQSKKTSPAALSKLAMDKNPDVKRAARLNPNTPKPVPRPRKKRVASDGGA